MTAILERRESESLWGRFCNWSEDDAGEDDYFVGEFKFVSVKPFFYADYLPCM
jgi:hypothetical protein